MAKFLPLPDGSLYEVPDNVTYADAMVAAQKDVPKAFGLEKKGAGAAFGQGLESLISSGRTAFEALAGSPEEAAKRGQLRQERIGQQYAEQIGLDLLKKKYEEEGLLSAGKELVRQVPLALAEQAPNIGATLAAGRTGAMLGSAFGPAGAVVGGLGGAALPSLVTQFGGNIERQAGEGRPIDVGAAGAAAVPQAALDVAGTFVPFGRTLVGKALGSGVEKALARGANEAAEKLAQESLKKTLLKGTLIGGAAEIPTEIAQQMLERAQAGLSLTSPDALSEYGNTAYQVGLLAPIGAAGRVVDRGAARKDIAQKQAAEAETAAAKAEQERLASPAYFDELTAQQAKIQEQLANMEYGLGRAKKEDAKARLQDRIDAKKNELADVQAQLAAHPLNPSAAAQAQSEQLAQLQAEETGIPAEFAAQQEQARLDFEEKARQLRYATGAGEQRAILGFEPRGEFIPTPDVAAQRAELDNQTKSLSVELAKINARIEAQQKELAAAAAAGDTTKAMELMAQAEKDKTPAYKAEIEKQLKAAQAQAAELKKSDPAEQLKALQKQFVKAGNEGNFEAIKILAPQIEALKQQVPAAAATAEPKQTQFGMFTEEGLPSPMAAKTVRAGEKREAGFRTAATKSAQARQAELAREEAQQLEGPATTELPLLEPEIKPLAEQLGVPQKAKPTEGGQRVLGRPAQPLGFEKANERVAAVLADYEDRAGEAQITPRSTRNLSNGLVTQSFGGYMDATGNPVTFNIIRNRDGAIVRAFTQDSLGKRQPVAKDFDPNTPDATIAHEVAKANEWTRGDRKQLVAAASEARNNLVDALIGKADSVRLENSLPRLDDQAAIELASELDDIINKHTFETGVAPQLGGRLSQAVARYAKQSPEEVKRGAVAAQKEEAAGFALEPQTEAQLAEKVAAEEGAGKTNRIDTVSQRLQEALDTKPTGAVRSVLEEAKRVVDSDKAPRTLLDEAEAQALRIINGKTPQLRTLYDETVIAKEGKVTEEAQQHFPQFAQRGTIRGTSEKFQRFLASPRMEFKRNEYIRAKKANADMVEEIKSLMNIGFKKEYAALEKKLNVLVDKLKRGNDIEQETKELIALHLKENPDYKRAVRVAKKAKKEWENTVEMLSGRYAEETKRAEELKAIETHWHSAIDADIKKKNPNRYPRNAFGLQEAYDDKLVSRAEYRKAKAAMEESEGIAEYLHEISSLQAEARRAYDKAQNTVDRYLREATQAAEGSKFIKQLKAEMDKLPAKIAKQEAALKAFAARVPAAMEGQAAFIQERARREEALAKERAALRNAQRAQAVVEATVKEVKETALREKRETDKRIAELTASLPTVSVRATEERISAGDIRYLKKERTSVIKDMKQAEKGLKEYPNDEEFKTDYATAKERLTQINRQLAEWQRKGAQVRGQPVGTTYYSREVTKKEGMSPTARAEVEREQRKEETESRKEAYAKRQQLLAEGRSTSVIGLRNEIEKLNARLAEKNENGKNVVSGSARTMMTAKRTSLDKKLAKLLKIDKILLSKAKYEKAPGNIIKPVEVVPSKKVEGTNLAKIEEEARAERAAELREDIDVQADLDFARATMLREAGPLLPEERQVDLNEAKKRADAISAKLAKSGIKMEYYRSLRDAPAKVQAALKYHNATGAKGMIFPDGTVAVFGDMHESMRDLEETIAHEVIGHYGVEGMLGAKGVQELTDKIFETDGLVYRVAEALGVWDEVRATEQSAIARGLNQNQQRVAMVRELIAHTAEKRGVPAGMVDVMKRWIKSLVNAVRNWFGRNGMDSLTKATSAEIQKLVMDAEKAYIKNELPAYVSPSGQVAFRTKVEYAPSYNPKLQQIANTVFAKNQTLKDKIKANATGLNFAIQFVDRFAGLEAVAKQMKDQLAAFQMMYWNRTYDARNMVVAETATNGPRVVKEQTRKDGHKEFVLDSSGTPGLKDIAEEVGKSAKRVGNANAALQQFGLYLVAKRAKRVGIDVAFGKNSSITPAELDDIIRNGDADPNFKQAAEMYAKYNKGLMNFLAQSGAISQKDADNMTKYNDYVGFYREKDGVIVDGEHNITIGDLTHNKFLKELLGSDQAIIDFQSSALQNTSLVTDIGLRNIATKNTAYTLEKLGMAKILTGKGPASGNVVRFKEKGVDKYAVIDDALGVPADLLVKSMEGISTSLPTAIRFMQGPANLLRKGVTRMPLYAVRQIIRDSLASVMTAGVDATPVTSSLKQLGSLIQGTNETERKLQAKGLIGGQVFSATPDDRKLILQDIAAGKDHWTTLMSKLDHLAMKADAASRVTAYNSYVKQGMSDMEASLAALEMMNFTKRGLSPNMLLASNMIPFFNAQVQGLNVLLKAFRGTSLFQEKLNIKGKLLKRGAAMAALSVLYAAMMGDDEAYKNATPEEKYNNWFVYLPGFDEPVRVPIPFEVGYIFKALPEAVFNLAATDEKASQVVKAFKQMAINTIPGGSNMLLPQALKPAVEVAANYSFFTGKPIEGSRLQAMEPSKRYGAGTSELAKAMGELLDVSPTQVDYLVRGYTGGLGAAIVALLNPLLASPEKPGTPEKKMSELSFIGQAFQPTDGRGLVQEAYDTMTRINQAKGSYNKLVEDGLLKEAEQYANNNADILAKSKPAGKFQKLMGELSKQIRQVQGDPAMTPKQKREAIDAIRQEQIALSKQLRSVE